MYELTILIIASHLSGDDIMAIAGHISLNFVRSDTMRSGPFAMDGVTSSRSEGFVDMGDSVMAGVRKLGETVREVPPPT